jgi:hypothetical protein
MFRVVPKFIYYPGSPDLALPEYSELQVRLQKQDEPAMILPPASGSAGY